MTQGIRTSLLDGYPDATIRLSARTKWLAGGGCIGQIFATAGSKYGTDRYGTTIDARLLLRHLFSWFCSVGLNALLALTEKQPSIRGRSIGGGDIPHQ
jgi:hypothetical protein